jgi:DnaK suppressor protein
MTLEQNKIEEQKETIKEKIKDELKHLEIEISNLEENSKPITPNCTLDDLGRTEAMTEVMVNSKILTQAELKRTRLKNALARVDNPTFGICIECEEPINIERIMVRPESIRCIKCAD